MEAKEEEERGLRSRLATGAQLVVLRDCGRTKPRAETKSEAEAESGAEAGAEAKAKAELAQVASLARRAGETLARSLNSAAELRERVERASCLLLPAADD